MLSTFGVSLAATAKNNKDEAEVVYQSNEVTDLNELYNRANKGVTDLKTKPNGKTKKNGKDIETKAISTSKGLVGHNQICTITGRSSTWEFIMENKLIDDWSIVSV